MQRSELRHLTWRIQAILDTKAQLRALLCYWCIVEYMIEAESWKQLPSALNTYLECNKESHTF